MILPTLIPTLPRNVSDKKSVEYRKETLKMLLYQIKQFESDVINALYIDFKKSEFESVLTETNIVISDLKYTIKNIDKWNKPKWVWPSIINFPSTDYIYSEPFGKVLIIAPWNYPFQLAMSPLVAAIAAGNRITLKPSELTPRVSAVIEKIIEYSCHPDIVKVVTGGADVSTKLLEKKWDYIFFTGSVKVGKIVALAAAKHLTPVTLELGGKNPCIIHTSANLKLAAKRIVWGKFVNAGQTCIAPDYILVDQYRKNDLIKALKHEIIEAYGENPKKSPDYPRIVNEVNFDRLHKMIDYEDVVHGGDVERETKYISPTLINENTLDSPLMQDEIFGPILPIITYKNDQDIDYILNKYENPLGFYVFSEDKNYSDTMMRKYAFGGGCVNDTMIQFVNKRLPFGGVGMSGIGAYHGKLSFDIFTHKKSVVKKATWLDIKLRYAPYTDKIKVINKFLKWI